MKKKQIYFQLKIIFILVTLINYLLTQTSCFGLPSIHPNVCSGNGNCVFNNTCSCNIGYSGIICNFTTCFEKNQSDINVN
jgi:hypothetical protein